jgi:hypothetical protein
MYVSVNRNFGLVGVTLAVLTAAIAGWIVPARRIGRGDLVTVLRAD